jgi:hypothetical protein
MQVFNITGRLAGNLRRNTNRKGEKSSLEDFLPGLFELEQNCELELSFKGYVINLQEVSGFI